MGDGDCHRADEKAGAQLTKVNKLSATTGSTAGEQDDLPYDGDEGLTCKYNSNSEDLHDRIENISHILSLSCSEDNNKAAAARYETHPQPEGVRDYHTATTPTAGISAEMPASEASFKKEASDRGFGKADGKEHLTNSKMSNVLLRHFSEGELLNTCQLIERETIPETSYTESVGETTNKPEAYEHGKRSLTPEQWAMELEGYYLEKHEDAHTGGKNPRVLNGNKFVSKRSISSTVNCGCRHDNSQLSNKYVDTHLSHNTKEQRELFKKTVSSHRLIHGQSEIHHCLPDFSKVTSELKVPKISENIKSVPTIDRTKSFPILLSQSVTVDNILENNCFHSVEVENQEEMSIPELFQQLKVIKML